MAGCEVETVGEARMEDHWEADHKIWLFREWIYTVDSSIFTCQMAGCEVETVGEARMEDHWEADHNDRLVEEWVYEVLQN
jgi:hypothetical protein